MLCSTSSGSSSISENSGEKKQTKSSGGSSSSRRRTNVVVAVEHVDIFDVDDDLDEDLDDVEQESDWALNLEDSSDIVVSSSTATAGAGTGAGASSRKNHHHGSGGDSCIPFRFSTSSSSRRHQKNGGGRCLKNKKRLALIMGTTVSLSSPEPEERNVVERAWHILSQKPLRMGSMLRLSRLMNDATANEKLILLNSGVIQRIVEMIDERSHISTTKSQSGGGNSSPAAKRNASGSATLQPQGQAAAASAQQQKSPGKAPRNNFVTQITTNSRRKSNAYNISHRGIGYGFGSTRSHWDIERTIEEQMAREEQMVWLMNALTAYIFCANPDFQDLDDVRQQALDRDRSHISQEFVAIMDSSSIVPMLEYHLKNESIFDISEHMEFYQALLELASSMCLYSSLTELLVYPHMGGTGGAPVPASASASASNSKRGTTATAMGERSICLHLLPRFRDQLLTYLTSPTVRMGSPDFRLIDFIQRVQKWCDVALTAGKTVMAQTRRQPSAAVGSSSTTPAGRASAKMRHYDSIDEGSGEYLMAKPDPVAGVGVAGVGAISSSSSGFTVSSSSSSTNANELGAVGGNGSPKELVPGPGPVPVPVPAPAPAPDTVSVKEEAVDMNSTKQAVEYRNALKVSCCMDFDEEMTPY